jgi:Zn-dependent protease
MMGFQMPILSALDFQGSIAGCIIWYFVFVYTTVLHEAGHAWAAYRLGDRTAYEGGQVSLDPIPHIKREPFGMVLVPLISWFAYQGQWMLGWASAPYDPTWAQRHPRRAAWMAMAGPGANLLILLVCGGLLKLGLIAGVFGFPDSFALDRVVDGMGGNKIWEGAATLLSLALSLQIVLLVLNLLPLPPLDGSALPLFFLNESAALRYMKFMWNPALRIFGLLLAWKIFGNVFWPVYQFVLGLLY